jgi:prolyl-tRNA synthetase
VAKAYNNIFRRCGVDTRPVEALSGTIGGVFCHEYMTVSPVGEDWTVICNSCNWAANLEAVRGSAEAAEVICPKCGENTKVVRTIENGHIFKLGTVYSNKMSATYIDRNGSTKPIPMGCYGIGLGRLLATVVEVNHDDRGIIWPKELSPYQVHLTVLDGHAPEIVAFAEEVFFKLNEAKISVLYDDRKEVSTGVKLMDADLLGIPLRVLVSHKTLSDDKKVELKLRNSSEVKLLHLENLIADILKN